MVFGRHAKIAISMMGVISIRRNRNGWRTKGKTHRSRPAVLLQKILVIVLLIAAFNAAPQSTSADTSLNPVATGTQPTAVAVNPVTNKIYVANQGGNVTVIDGASNTTTTVGAAATPTAVAVNPVTNKIYVANFNSANVTIIDGASNTTTTVATGTRPRAVAVNPVTNKIYVANYDSDNVTVIDGANNTTTTVEVGTAPRAVFVNPETNQIYVANYISNNVTVIDGASNSTTTVAVGTAPLAVAVNPVTNQIYVANYISNNVTVIDGASNTTTTVATGTQPRAVAVNPVTNKIYVANQVSANVTVIDGASNTTTTVGAGNNPTVVAVNPVTNKIYVANEGSANVTVIDGASNTTTMVTVGATPNAVAVNPVMNKIYVTNFTSANVTVIDGASNTTTTVETGKYPLGLAVNPETNKIYVANLNSDNVTVIDGASNTTTTVAAGTSPTAVAVDPVTNKIYVANYGSNTVTVIDGASNTTTTVEVGAAPTAVAVNPVTNKIYVANYGSNTVTVIDGASNTTTTVVAGAAPTAVAVNPVTNKIYVANYDSNNVTVIDGASNTPTTVGAGTQPQAVAVNPVTNKIYVANSSSANLTVIDGASNTTTTVGAGTTPTAVAVNPVTNKIYVANLSSNTVTVIDGASNTTTVTVGSNPNAVAVNLVTNKIYIANYGSSNVTVIDSAGRTTNPLTVAITPLPGNIAYGTEATFTFQVSNTYSPYSPEVQGLYFQLDHTEGAWVQANPSGGNWTGTVTSLTYGQHVLYVLALEAQGDGVPAGIANAYAFNVLPESTISPTIASFDKYAGAASYADVATTLTLHYNTLASISDGVTTLLPGTDYTVVGNVVTIKKAYLAAQPVGTTTLTFTFSAGATQTLSVTVSDSTPPPSAPSGLSAIAGNGQIALSWSGVPGTVTYSVYAGTASGAYGSTPIVTVNGSTTSYTAIGLTNGTTYYFAVTASNAGGDSNYSNEVSATPRTGSTSSDTNPSSNDNAINNQDMLTSNIVAINGQQFEAITTGAATIENGRTVLTATVDATKLSGLLAKEEDKPVIVILVTSSADKVRVALTGDAVKTIENKQALLEVQTSNGNYKLPAAAIEIDRLAAQLGEQVKLSDILVHVDIAKSETAKITLLENAAKKGRFTVMTPPVDFTVTASYNGKTVNLDKFTTYVGREIPLPDGVDPNKVTTAVVLEADGTARHVPTYLTFRDGKNYAVASSLTNSTYALIGRPTTFADVEGHWAQAAVHDMASRMVVNGVDESHYQPNAAITRAQFASILVRALGLADNGENAAFGDVNPGDSYVGAVTKAQEYGIVSGYEDGTFRPAKTITREEAMVMIARAMKLAGLETSFSDTEADAVLSKFADRASVAIWAKQAVASTVRSGLVSGSNAGLQPKSDITRAETAVIVQRLLERAKLIDNKHIR